MRDSFGRTIDYLRVSVTDNCNLRCVYCMPATGVERRTHDEILRFEELERILRVAVDLGIRRIRVTGGEPLVRRGIVDFLARVAHLPGTEEVTLTTNGVLLDELAEPIRAAGVRRLNVSLDTLRPERFRELTRGGSLGRVLRGVAAAEAAGFDPLKLNVVLLRENLEEVEQFAALTRERALHVRFIELMPLGEGSCYAGGHFVPATEARRRLEERFELEPALVQGSGPAVSWRVRGGRGTVGFIAALTEHFCDRCNRLRLSADGRLSPCLASDQAVSLRDALRGGATDRELVRLLHLAVRAKPQEHRMESGQGKGRRMSQLGG